jgi:methionine synthase II (cobalamin-independent)
MAFGANQQLREDMWDYRARPSAGENENILRFTQSAATDYGATALDLVNQAAEIFNGMEQHAREADARARALCASLTEKLQLAERQRDSSERARHEVVNEFNCKLQDIARALEQAQSRILHAEEKAVAAEFRAQAFEARLQKANRDLAAVEEAIRTRLL